mmetsp:Transcript_47919/g.111951  ORF Transcript_47919/g.111951 Transcript_47919/m.111951 type:complete len:663 (-) Transcript_47919:88-2076(-)
MGVVEQLNCTAREFVQSALDGVIQQLKLAGVAHNVRPSVSYHFDQGHSHARQDAVQSVTAAEFNTEADTSDEDCSESQLSQCADAVASLASLDGLSDYLLDALAHGVARPHPERLARMGWAPAASALLAPAGVREGGAFELGGGSGAGFQVICEDRGIATLGGGGGGGAFGWMRARSDDLQSAGARAVEENETVGGGAGGGMQIFFPASVTPEPWKADHWISWGSGGGHGCGSCKAGDEFCEESPFRITCGAKMDDNGAVGESDGSQAVRSWREGVLRSCYDSGRLAVIGGGGGGAGGARCCASVPRLKYGFGFYAELRPPSDEEALLPARRMEESNASSALCCPALPSGNGSLEAEHSASLGLRQAGRRLATMYGGLGGGPLPAELAGLVDPFARENTGHQPPGHANRRPALQELMRQHDKRLGVHRPALIDRASGPSCELPAWLNETELTALGTGAGQTSADGSGTKEPEVALKYIFKFNPLQGYLADGAGRCGGWSDWCCVCHAAQWQVACLPESEKALVDWFLTEDCCESKMKKDTSSPGYVADATPLRDSSVLWRPLVGWIEVPRKMNFSDSYHWLSELGDPSVCPMVVGPEFWEAPEFGSEPPVVQPTGVALHEGSWRLSETAMCVFLMILAVFVKGRKPGRCAVAEERYVELIEV